jgi:hypothetical protein
MPNGPKYQKVKNPWFKRLTFRCASRSGFVCLTIFSTGSSGDKKVRLFENNLTPPSVFLATELSALSSLDFLLVVVL